MAETEQPKWSNMYSNDEMHILANYLDRIPPINILSVLHVYTIEVMLQMN